MNLRFFAVLGLSSTFVFSVPVLACKMTPLGHSKLLLESVLKKYSDGASHDEKITRLELTEAGLVRLFAIKNSKRVKFSYRVDIGPDCSVEVQEVLK